jgi:hypothetical protein
MIVVEDAHLMDSGSRSTIVAIAKARCPGLAMVIAGSPEDG